MCHPLMSSVRMAAAVAVVSWLMGAPALAAPLRNAPVTLTQPNGLVLRCLVSGDEYLNWIHDAAGYTIIPDPNTGYYTYAVLEDGVPRASQYVVGWDDPAAAGLPRNALPRRDEMAQLLGGGPEAPLWDIPEPHFTPTIGTVNNLVVFIRFSGEADFPAAPGTYDAAFNAATSGANSERHYFQEASYNQLTIVSTLYPTQDQTYTVSVQDSHVRGYYQPYNAATNPDGYQSHYPEGREREYALLAAALNAVASLVPSGLQLDIDEDGFIDAISFVVRGELTGGDGVLWPHKGNLQSPIVNINGKRAFGYTLQNERPFSVGIFCHEMGHSLGAPDLYNYVWNGIAPVFIWDPMGAQYDPPQHVSAYMKFKYFGWIASIPTISAPGTYTLNPLTSATGNAYRINSPYSSSEYFMVEFRRRTGIFESSLPGEGIVVYRINTRVNYGNASGPPDEVYVYRPDGTPTTNGAPKNASFNAGVSRTAINDYTNPSSFLSSGGPGGLSLSSISSVGATMSFYLGPPVPPPGRITGTITAAGTGAPLANVGVLVYEASGSLFTSVTTNASGVYATTGLPAGTYYVRTSNGLGCVDELYDNLLCPGGACAVTKGTGVSVTAWATTSGINFGLARPGTGDFTGDQQSDVLWHHATRGEVWIWPMNGATRVSETPVAAVPDIGYRIAGTGDFDGDGMADLVWHHATRGEVWVWRMQGATRVSETRVGTVPDVDYRIVGAGDFDGDGKADLVWHHATRGEVWVWRMQGTTMVSEMKVATVGDVGYRIVGTGDFNGDGKADLVWHHATRGEVWIWPMNGATRVSETLAGTVPDTEYQVVGVGDYTGDGRADLLWHHATRGEVWMWPMNGTARLSETQVATVPDTEYQIVGNGDYNGDGKADILWHHARRGEVWVWLMNGAVPMSQTYVGTVPDVGYQIVTVK